MLAIVIKIFSILFWSIYFFAKISYKPLQFKLDKFKLTLLLFTMTVISVVLRYTNPNFTYFIPFLILWVIAGALSYEPQKSFILTTLSFVISMETYALSSFLSSLILCAFFKDEATFPYTILAILSSSLQGLSIHLLCQTKRFRKGMPFLSTYNILNAATFVCIFISLFSFWVVGNYGTTLIQKVCFFAILFALTFLIYWWQAQITKSYRRSLEKRELESLRIEVQEKDAFINKLMQDNDRLAIITHRDNTLISTLKNSTVTYLRTNFETEAERIVTGEQLVANIEKLSEGRASVQPESIFKTGRTFDTGISLLDELLRHMDEEAVQNKILFSVHMGTELRNFVPKDISESELVHLIDDLLKNAFKATMKVEKRMVQLQFYKLDKHFVVEVADNGIPFEVRSLVNMGIEKLTTYADGSGIGLMDIWNTKENLRATYHLEEYASPSPFSKKVSLTFDKKNRFSIRTWRKNEILQVSKRADLQVYDNVE